MVNSRSTSDEHAWGDAPGDGAAVVPSAALEPSPTSMSKRDSRVKRSGPSDPAATFDPAFADQVNVDLYPFAADGMRCRPLTQQQLQVGAQVMFAVLHAGEHFLAPAVITAADVTTITSGWGWGVPTDEILGTSTHFTFVDCFGSKHGVSVLSTMAALDRQYPPQDWPQGLSAAGIFEAKSRRYAVERATAIATMRSSGAFWLDDDGSFSLRMAQIWGSRLNLSVMVPDVDPDEVQATVERLLALEYPEARITKAKAQPVANFRANVYAKAGGAKNGAAVAVNVLTVEASQMAGSGFTVQQVPYGTPAPIVGI